jgi:hypothetical protein
VKNWADHCLNLGKIDRAGAKGVAVDKERGNGYLTKACEAGGSGPACMILARAYSVGVPEGMPEVDNGKAEALLERCCPLAMVMQTEAGTAHGDVKAILGESNPVARSAGVVGCQTKARFHLGLLRPKDVDTEPYQRNYKAGIAALWAGCNETGPAEHRNDHEKNLCCREIAILVQDQVNQGPCGE